MEFYFEKLINRTKNIEINQWIAGKQLFQITIISCVIMDTDSLVSLILSDPFLTQSTAQPFTFGPQFLVVEAQTFINESFCIPGQVHQFWF